MEGGSQQWRGRYDGGCRSEIFDYSTIRIGSLPPITFQVLILQDVQDGPGPITAESAVPVLVGMKEIQTGGTGLMFEFREIVDLEKRISSCVAKKNTVWGTGGIT